MTRRSDSFQLRLSDQERLALHYVCTHHGIKGADMVRKLIQAERERLAAHDEQAVLGKFMGTLYGKDPTPFMTRGAAQYLSEPGAPGSDPDAAPLRAPRARKKNTK